jgi:hypothetical protein
MDIPTEFVAILLGVVLSIVLPVVIKWAVLPAVRGAGTMEYLKRILMPYIKAGIASIVISFLILLFAPAGLDSYQAAALLGFGWQAFIKNLITKEP